MSTLADELLQDFEDFGSDEEVADDGAIEGEAPTNGKPTIGDMSEGEEEEEDEEMTDVVDEAKILGDDAEEAKVKVEKMKLGVVKDVRSVATLMDTLGPVLEVRIPMSCPPFYHFSCSLGTPPLRITVYILF